MDTLHATRLEKPVPGPYPGMMQVGYVEVRPGEWLPLYESQPPEDRPSINTPEGWAKLVERMNGHAH